MSGQSSRHKTSVTLYIMRHGAAEHSAMTDAKRQLVEFGQQQVTDTSQWLAQSSPEIGFDLALVSPYTRAQQTFDIVKQSIHVDRELDCDMIVPEGSVEDTHNYLIGLLASAESMPRLNHILLVSHMPFVSLFLAKLLYSGNASLFNTGSMAIVECDRDVLKGHLVSHHQSIL